MTNKKRKILLCNEASFLNSGYANYGRQIMQRLFDTNKYELAELGCYGIAQDPRRKSIPWKYYPNSVDINDSRYEKYTSNTINQFGHWRFEIVCLDFKPDIVFDVRDPWMFDYQSCSHLRKFFNWVVMPAMDSIPQKIEWLTSFNTADILVPYTEWAMEYLSGFNNLYPKTTPAGVDSSVFKITNNKKERMGLPTDSFVVGAVMRNQRRKLIPALFEVIKRVKEKHPNTILYLHTTFPEMAGWNIPSLLIDFELIDSVYFTYKCKKCKVFYPSKFIGPQTFCKKCGEFTCGMSNTMDGISDHEMVDIYNMFDLYIQYAICEGFGMPQIEASACGVPVASVDYSAMSEIVRNIGGFPIKLASLSYEIESHAKRAYPDIDETIKIIIDYIESSQDYKHSKKEETVEKTILHYNWKNIANVWEQIFDGCDISKNKNWYNEPQFTIPKNITIDHSLSHFEIIYNIVVNIIKEPWLMNTNFIQTTLKEIDYGIRHKDNKLSPFTKKMALEQLELYTNAKTFIEELRVSNEKINEDYLLL